MSTISVTSLWESAKLREKLTIIIGLAYIILPFDFIPEIILGPLGLLDDGGAMLAVIVALKAVYDRHKSSPKGVVEAQEVRR